LLSLIIASTPSSFEYSLEVQIALLRMLKGSCKNKFTFLGVAAPVWQGVKAQPGRMLRRKKT
jgi:hypothetical protein